MANLRTANTGFISWSWPQQSHILSNLAKTTFQFSVAKFLILQTDFPRPTGSLFRFHSLKNTNSCIIIYGSYNKAPIGGDGAKKQEDEGLTRQFTLILKILPCKLEWKYQASHIKHDFTVCGAKVDLRNEVREREREEEKKFRPKNQR